MSTFTHQRCRSAESDVVVSCEVNPKHGLPHVLYFRAGDCPLPPSLLLHSLDASHLRLNPFPPSHSPSCVCFFLFRLSLCSLLISTYLFCNIKPYLGCFPSDTTFKCWNWKPSAACCRKSHSEENFIWRHEFSLWKQNCDFWDATPYGLVEVWHIFGTY